MIEIYAQSYNGQPASADLRCVFGAEGGTFGRGSDNQLPLVESVEAHRRGWVRATLVEPVETPAARPVLPAIEQVRSRPTACRLAITAL